MQNFTGTWRLVRLNVRRDSIKLPIWIISIVAIVATSIPAIEKFYSSFSSQVNHAASAAGSSIYRAFGGVPDGPSLGSSLMMETYVFTAILVAFMSTTAIIRHTRANEESGSAELIGSTVVGRYSSLMAALIVVFIANLEIGLLLTLVASLVNEFTLTAAFGFGMSFVMVGFAFAAIAAVAAQLSNSGRGANGLATMAIGGAFLLKAIGDGFASVNGDGLSAASSWPSYLSPLGLSYQIFPFTQQNWWIFGVFAVGISLTVALAYFLLVRRDVGSGILPEKRGPATAPKRLLSVMGLSWRLQKGTFIGWAIFFIVFGFIFGGMVSEFEGFITGSDEGEEFLEMITQDTTFVKGFFGFIVNYAGIMAVGYSLMVLLKMRTEESSGRLEFVLGSAVSRVKWVLSYLNIAFIGSAVLITTMAISSLVIFNATGGGGVSYMDTIKLGLMQLPAVVVFMSIAVLSFGLLPRVTVGLSWAMFIGVMLIVQLGAMLELPQWAINISPFTHSPVAIGGDVDWKPLIIMLAIGLVFLVMGLYKFNNRDLDLE